MGSDIFPVVALAQAAHPTRIMTRSHFNDDHDDDDDVDDDDDDRDGDGDDDGDGDGGVC